MALSLGSRPAPDLYDAGDDPPEMDVLVVGAVYGALTTILDQVTRAHHGEAAALNEMEISDFLDAIFDQLKAGFSRSTVVFS